MPIGVAFFDMTNTLVYEHPMDKAVCKGMEREIAKKRGISFKDAHRVYTAYLKDLERKRSWKWYAYPVHGDHFEIDWRKPQLENLDKLRLFPYARRNLECTRIDGYKICLATNAAEEVANMRVKSVGLLDCFDLIVGCDTVRARKSEGKHYEYGLKKLNGEASYSCVFGDDLEEDIGPGERLGMRTVLCEDAPAPYRHTRRISNGSHEVPHFWVSVFDMFRSHDLFSQQF